MKFDVENWWQIMGELAVDKHVHYILSVEKVGLKLIDIQFLFSIFQTPFLSQVDYFGVGYGWRKDSFESVVMDHLRKNGACWD